MNRDKAFGDAVYETRRRGGNPDAVSMERIDHNYYDGTAETWEDAAHQEASRVVDMRERRQERELAEYERHLEYERYLAERQQEDMEAEE